MTPVARTALAIAAAIYGFGGVMHALAYFGKTAAMIGASNLSSFLGSELRVLWLADSATLVGLAVTFGLIVARPAAASGALLLVMAIIPAGTTGLLYGFLGGFYAAHLLALATALVLFAGWRWNRNAGRPAAGAAA